MNKRKNVVIKILLLTVFFSYLGFKVYEQQRILDIKNRELLQLETMLTEEKQLNADLLEQKEILFTNEYVEKVAREKLGMVKDGEKIFVDVNE